MRKLLQGHLDQRRPGEAAGPVAGADGVERRERRVHKRAVETIFGTVDIDRVGYAFDEALSDLSDSIDAEVPKRQAEQLAVPISVPVAVELAPVADPGVPISVPVAVELAPVADPGDHPKRQPPVHGRP